MANPFSAVGATPTKQTKYAPIFTNRFFTGIWTQRNPLRDAATTFLNEKAYAIRYDSLIDGLNTEITNRLTLARRPGLTVYNSQTFPAINRFYEFRQILSGVEVIKVLADTASIIYDATGPATQTTILTKSAGAGQAHFQSVGNLLFIGDGVSESVWNGVTTRNWGIVGPNTEPVWLTDAGNDILDGYPTWIANNPYTIPYLILDSNFNLQFLITEGTSGGVAPTWNTDLAGVTTDNTAEWKNVGNIALVHIDAPESLVTYAYAFRNSGDGTPAEAFGEHVSTASPRMTNTSHHLDGSPFSISGGGVDPAVYPHADTVRIYRTLSGGSTLFFVADIANPGTPGNPGTWTYTDLIKDIELNEFIQAAENNSNDPPPTGLINLTFHMGRIFGSVGNTIYYSNGPDAIEGSGDEGFNPDNFFSYPSKVQRIWPMALGALVFTTSDTYIIGGKGTSGDPLFSIPFLPKLGLANYNAFDANGSLAYLVATDLTFNSLDPSSGYSEIGFPIGDLIEDQVTADNAYVTWHNGGSRDKALYLAIAAGLGSGSGVAGFVDSETPTGAINGANVTFVLSSTPNPAASLMLFLNGVLMTAGGGADYTLAGPVVTFNTAPATGDILLAWYRVGASGTFVDATAPTGAIDGANVTFTLPSSPNQATSLMLFLNGVGQRAGGADYTLAGLTITYGVAPLAGDTLIGWYRTGAPSGYVNAEVPAGAINSVNTSFTLASAVVPATSLMLFLNGIEQKTGTDYTLAGTTIIFGVAPSTGDTLVAWYRTGTPATGGSGWFRMNQTAAPETGLNWSPFASVNQNPDPNLAGCSAVQSLETVPGIHKLLVGPFSSGPILMRDLDVNTDNGIAYSAYATIGSLVLANPGQLAGVGFITTDCPATGTSPVPTVWFNEDSTAPNAPAGAALTDFVDDPPQLAASTTFLGKRYYMAQTEEPAWCRHMQLKFDWGTVDSPDEMLSYTIFGTVVEE